MQAVAADAGEQQEVIAFLADPATYGVAEVERFDTHASIVFLAGSHAYKLKRALKFSYLDYSTAEQRRQFCELELTLNRRTAPALYLEVRSINRDPTGRLAFNGQGPPLDWVLVMRRFDQEALFDRMADRGALTTPLMLHLADQIAAFHAVTEQVTDSGGHDGIARTAESDARNLRAAVPDVLDGPAVERLIAAAAARIAALAPLLEERRRSGRVRHCHGDLHLRNICLVDGQPTLFDCIEFNRTMACIDVLYDLAFLLMDLHHRRLDDLGNAVFNRYLDLGDEVEGVAAMTLFLAMRAGIRAHVSAAAVARVDASERAPMAQLARDYLAMAARLVEPAPPRLIAVGGVSGTGKSSLAYGLAPAIGAVPGARVLRSDVIRKRLFGVALTERLPPAAYDSKVTARVFDRLRDLAARILAAGYSVVADAVYARPAEREALAEVARQAGVPFTGFWLEAPTPLLEQRIAARRGDASDATVAVLRQQLTNDIGVMTWHRLDASGDAAGLLAAARRVLAQSSAR
jgi:hypothetical protein